MKRFITIPTVLATITALAGFSQAAPPTLERTIYHGAAAFRLSDGKTEAVIVPEFSGRIMRYGAVGGHNWLWNSGPKKPGGKWTNLGGDKCFIGPHFDWNLFSTKSLWPPPFPAWDGAPHEVAELSGARLRTISPVWDGFEVRIIREFSFDETGALVISQRLEKSGDTPVFISAWTVSQAAPPDAVFIPLNPKSAYAGGFYPWKPLPAEALVEKVSPTLLRLNPTSGTGYKIGSDSSVPSIAAVVDRTVWLQRAEFQAGNYPDGADGAGFPIEYYNHNAAGAGQYIELELLSPRSALKKGESITHNIRWSLHTLKTGGLSEAAAHAEIEALLLSKPGHRQQ